MEISPDQFKIVSSSPASLKEVNKGLLKFKSELKSKKTRSGYVPLTMDELLNRFVLNLHRNETLDNFNE